MHKRRQGVQQRLYALCNTDDLYLRTAEVAGRHMEHDDDL
jgi:hypothetical protein